MEDNKKVLTLMPLADILDGEDAVTVWFEVPGVNAEATEIEVKDQVLSLTGASTLVRNGRPVVFKRQFQLSDAADVEKITAETRDGVLTLVIPKLQRSKVHRIDVK